MGDGSLQVFRVDLQSPTEDLGFEYECQTFPDGTGIVRLTAILPHGAFGRGGVRPGVLVSINDVKTGSVDDLRRAVKKVQMEQMEEVVVVMQVDDGGDSDYTADEADVEPIHPVQTQRRRVSRRRPTRGASASRSKYRQPRAAPDRGRGRRGRGQSGVRHAESRMEHTRRVSSRDLRDMRESRYEPPRHERRNETMSEEEQLALRLQRLATMRRRGEISQDSWEQAKQTIIDRLGGARPAAHRDPAGRAEQAPDARHSFAPPSTWARVNLPRYVFLRGAAFRGAPWVEGEGVSGLLHVARIEGDFALVRSELTQETGYIRSRYLDFMAPSWHPPKLAGGGGGAPAARPPRASGRQLSDIISDDGDEWLAQPPPTISGEARARSLGPAVRQPGSHYPMDYSGYPPGGMVETESAYPLGPTGGPRPATAYTLPGGGPGVYDAPPPQWITPPPAAAAAPWGQGGGGWQQQQGGYADAPSQQPFDGAYADAAYPPYAGTAYP